RLHVENGRIEIVAAPEAEPPAAAPGRPAESERGPLPDVPTNLGVEDMLIESVAVEGLGAPLRIDTLAAAIRDGSIELDRIAVGRGGDTLVASGDIAFEPERAAGTLAGSATLSPDDDAADGAGASHRIDFATALA